MHFMPDTEEEDSAAEAFWPEGYKKVIRDDVREEVGTLLNNGKRLRHVYKKQYSEKYSNINEFVNKIADMIVIGADNGADDAFDEIIDSFLAESPLPEERRHALYLWPKLITKQAKEKLRQIIIDEYSQDDVYSHAYKVGYGPNARDNVNRGSFSTFDDYINRVAQLIVTGAMNGADDMLEAMYQAFFTTSHLPRHEDIPGD